MPRQQRVAPSDAPVDSSCSELLVLIASLAQRLASGAAAGLADPLDDLLEMLRAGLDLDECSLWRVSDDASESPERLARAPGGSVELETADLPAPYGSKSEVAASTVLTSIGLTDDETERGVLVSSRRKEMSELERTMLTTAAYLVGSALAADENARRAAEAMVERTRLIDEQRRFIERIVDSLPVGLYVVDREYRVHAWNRKRETGLQGVLREEALGRTIFEILRRQPADMLRQEFDEVFRTGTMKQFEMTSNAAGELRTYRVSKIPMRINDAAVTHVITIGEDITEWKRAHERVAEAQRLAALGQLSAGVMHEINNPLATIAACAESLSLQLNESGVPAPLHDSIAEYTHIIDHEVHRSKRIVDGLLDFSRPRGDAKEAVDPNEVVEHTLFLLKHHPRFKHVKVEASLEAAIDPPLFGSREQLAQVLMALLLNASDSMDGTGRVVIRSRTGDAPELGVVIEVEDQGHGIAGSELGRLFEPFYTTKSPGRGTGLGLSICYGIVADHGGRIEVDSQLGEGSTFRVHLPAGQGKPTTDGHGRGRTT
ncbi:MAG: two-component system sensor histidine kinase NtrB [Gemmatimonadaceae bacterium]